MNSLSFSGLLDITGASKAVCDLALKVKKAAFPVEIEGAQGSLASLVIAKAFLETGGQFFVVVPTLSGARELALDLASFASEFDISVMTVPLWGTAPYAKLSPFSAVFGERVKVFSALARQKSGITIIPQRALLSPLPGPDYIKDKLISLFQGGEIDTVLLAQKLVSYGYSRVPRAQVHGEFALRGEVLDIIMGGDETEDEAYRVVFDFDTVESVKKFDPQLQFTVNEKLDELVIRPMKEVIWTDDRIAVLEKKLSSLKEFENGAKEIIEELAGKRAFYGEHMFYPLAFEKPSTLFDYLGKNSVLFLLETERLDNAKEVIEREYRHSYAGLKRNPNAKEFVYPLPERFLLSYPDLIDDYKQKNGRLVSFLTIKKESKEGIQRVELPCEPARSFFGNMDYLNEEFLALLRNDWRIAVAAESETQARRIAKILEPLDGEAGKETKARAPRSALPLESYPLTIMPIPLTAGFSLTDIKFMLIQENEIFGRRKRSPVSLKTAKSSPVDSFIELNPGDYIVHVNHGIGLFKGIERKTVSNHERDYIHIEYAQEEFVFVPVEQVNLVQRYIGNDGQPPRLDTLGSKSWENRKGKVKSAVEDIAEKLIVLYSKRKKAQGFAFAKDCEWQTMFEAAFPFEETEDQLRCIEEIKKDMESPVPMDRLVCGDVGYGKTEVALRACFKAVMCGKQTAFLAPTTILAEQHYENFLERFSRFPVNVAMLSRFVEGKKRSHILRQVKDGGIDLLVGTHRIIQKDVQFKNLGLLVIDEEQRFGVKDKERLKELKTNVDCLSLSATPIPRTLHMSMVKIRDMSVLATAPPGRRPIETIVEEYDDKRIAAAVRAEVERGGQVFFLHNRIETLVDTRVKLEKLLPEMLIETAHGRMEARDLEDVMRRFIRGGFHVLVSTTIIENGIDIPNVNTIIIDRADSYGVSQLYQLRGRVGRCDRAAYAYLFYPGKKALSEIAMKRLQTISDFTELGSGFKIAMKDLEIRGAGNLLGREQSGYIYAVGFDLYLRLLEEAVKRLENTDYEPDSEPLLELEYSGFIPDSYIDSPQEKMEVYKLIASISCQEELDGVYALVEDRFGPLVDEVASLLSLAEIRIICKKLAVSSLKERGGTARIEFSKISRVKVDRLIRMMQESSGKVKIDSKKPNVILLETGNINLKEKSEYLREKLSVLAG